MVSRKCFPIMDHTGPQEVWMVSCPTIYHCLVLVGGCSEIEISQLECGIYTKYRTVRAIIVASLPPRHQSYRVVLQPPSADA